MNGPINSEKAAWSTLDIIWTVNSIMHVPHGPTARAIFSEKESKMSQTEQLEMLILGSGEGGKFLAWHMAHSGHRTAVVERKLIGGSCPNTNCLPSKNEIWSAKVADLVRRADQFGIVAGSPALDMTRVLARKREMVNGLIAMHLDRYKASGAELIMGAGRFVAPKTIEVALNNGGPDS
jgi:pyruvate/2-oxoglutarate dehydrogenase complex dihydrolipoamide dehydrogenase (E3) component